MTELRDFIADLVSSIRQSAAITGYTDNGDGTVTATVSDILDVEAGLYITIDGTAYKVTATTASTITFEADAVPTGSSFIEAFPYFKSGTVIAADNELKAENIEGLKYPLIYLMESFRMRENLNPLVNLGAAYSCRFFFITPSNYVDNLTDDFYTEPIPYLNEVVNRFIAKLKANNFVLYKDLEEIERVNHPKFGLEIVEKGKVSALFTDKLSAVELELVIPMNKRFNPCKYRNIDFRVCAPVSIYENGVFTQTVAAGGKFEYSTAAGDATAVLKDTAGSVLSTTSIPAGDTQDITAPDGSAVLKNSANTTISTTAVKSGETKNITVADDSVRNSDSSYVANDIVQGVQKVLPDITFTDTDGATSSKPSVKNFSATLIPALSGSQLNNADAGLTSAQRQLINRVNESRTGQTTSYRTGDDGDFEYGRNTNFTTLASNNPFGNTNRFTDQSGGQTYSDNIVVDWMTGLMWFRTPTTTADWNAAIDGALAATSGGYTDWFLPNFQQLFSIGSFGNTQLLNYAPFSLTITTTGATLWTSTTRAASTTEAYILSLNGAISNVAKTGTNRSYIYCRQFSYSNGTFS